MNALQFIKLKINYLSGLFPSVNFKYEFNSTNNLFLIKIKPKKNFTETELLINKLDLILSEFSNLYDYVDLVVSTHY